MIRMFIAMTTVLVTASIGGGVMSAQAALTCSQFASQAEAQAAYTLDPTDPAGNDEDGDGIACEDVIYSNSATDLTPVRGTGAAGMTSSGESGRTPVRGVGAPGTVSNEREGVVGTMSGMPNTGVGTFDIGSWLLPATLLLVAAAAGWASIRCRLSSVKMSAVRAWPSR